MKHTATMQSHDGLFTLEYDVYEPNNFNGTLVQIAHGMSEHKNRYQSFCDYLCSKGYVVVIHDHRGHGKSVNESHRLGDMGKNGFQEAVHDIYELTQRMKKQYHPKSFVLLGHSMGSLLSRAYLRQYEDELDGLILTGTPSIQFGLSGGMFLARMIMFLRGNTYQSQMLQKLTFGTFNRPFPNRTGFEWLNQDEKEVDAYVKDELCGFSFGARSYYDLFAGMKWVFGKYELPKKPLLPIMFLSGDEDPCGKMGQGVKRCYQHLQRQGYQNVGMTLFPKMRHEILLEVDREIVYEKIASFLGKIKIS